MSELTAKQISDERGQGLSTRKDLYLDLEKILGVPVISFFTSFVYPIMIEDTDAEMLEGLLQICENLNNGFALLISSPGGDGLAAERIVNVCRTYSGKNGYIALVPAKAKSAATMVCFGASKLFMGDTSELGAID